MPLLNGRSAGFKQNDYRFKSPNVEPDTWNPDYKGTQVTLSNGNKTATKSAFTSPSLTRSKTSKSSGKFYFEILYKYPGRPPGPEFGAAVQFGLVPPSILPNAYPYTGAGVIVPRESDLIRWKQFSGSNVNLGPTQHAGHTFGLACDWVSGKVFGHIDGVYFLSGDPVAGTGFLSNTLNGEFYILAGSPSTADPWECTIRTTQSEFAYSVPSGYLPWSS